MPLVQGTSSSASSLKLCSDVLSFFRGDASLKVAMTCSPCYCCEVQAHGFCVRTWPKQGAGSSRRCRNHSHTSHTLGLRGPRHFQFANCAAVVTVCDNDAHATILQAPAWRFHVQTHKPAPPHHGALSGAPRAAACARVSACF